VFKNLEARYFGKTKYDGDIVEFLTSFIFIVTLNLTMVLDSIYVFRIDIAYPYFKSDSKKIKFPRKVEKLFFNLTEHSFFPCLGNLIFLSCAIFEARV